MPELNPLPGPLQAANRAWHKLKSFRNAHSLDPKQLLLAVGSHNQLMTAAPHYLLIGEKILQFDRKGQPNGLKPVPRTPMPQYYVRTDAIGVKKLSSGAGFRANV